MWRCLDLEPERHQHPRPEVLPRHPRHAGTGVVAPPGGRPCGRHDHGLGPQGRLLRRRGRGGHFSDELKYLIIHQKAAFNSPVWFNIGVEGVPQQAAACFILAVEDSMDSILNWYVEEGTIFKGGSGAGVNLSNIRSSNELLKGGGTASGPVSFMRGADASAGTIKSGGKTRRAAKMVILDADHPDIEDFIWCKAIEERKARVLAQPASTWTSTAETAIVQYQNANNSVRVTDEFMEAVIDGADWHLTSRTSARSSRRSGPATCSARSPRPRGSARIPACSSTPPSTGGTPRRTPAGSTGAIPARSTCTSTTRLQPREPQPDEVPGRRRHLRRRGLRGRGHRRVHRPGDHRRQRRLPDREDRRDDAPVPPAGPRLRQPRRAAHGPGPALRLGRGPGLGGGHHGADDRHAYATSARTAAGWDPSPASTRTPEPMLDVLRMHRSEVAKIDEELVPTELLSAAQEAWDMAVDLAEAYGVRNSQATVLAPTGTIGFLMDCDTTGIEPDLGLVKTKKLVGGGTMSIVNQTVPRALKRLGYSTDEIDQIVAYIDEHKTILGAPNLKASHLPVFACSMGDNTIHYLGHVRMMGAVQPFISGAISKTVNLPEEATVEDVEQLHIDAWQMGMKAVAIYRDNCKVAQPLSTTKKEARAHRSWPMMTKRTGGGARSARTRERALERIAELEGALQQRHVVAPATTTRTRLPRKRRSTPSRSGWPTARATSPSASTRTAGPGRCS